VVVQVIHVGDVAVLDAEDDPPIRLNRNAPEAGEGAFQGMQAPTGQVHVLGPGRSIKAREHASDLLDVNGVQSTCAVILIEAFEPTMANPPDHPADVM